jgi:hypothetical protein
MKDYIVQLGERPTTVENMEGVVWQMITAQKIRDRVASMSERVQAVIDTHGVVLRINCLFLGA